MLSKLFLNKKQNNSNQYAHLLISFADHVPKVHSPPPTAKQKGIPYSTGLHDTALLVPCGGRRSRELRFGLEI